MMKKIRLLSWIAACVACIGTVSAQEMTIALGQGGPVLKLLKVKAGSFTMGSPATEMYRRSSEAQRNVTISKDFWLGETEVTQGQWMAVMQGNPSKHQGNAALPVENVSWNDAMAFCAKLTEGARQAGLITAAQSFTLPTEAQWEYACRAGSGKPFAFGDVLDCTMANFDGNHPYGKSTQIPKYLNQTTPVGSYAPNGWGFKDMHGNVIEWCLDWYEETPVATSTDPAGPAEGTYKVYRGGHFRDIGASCRSAFRYFNLPGFAYAYLGFRVALVNGK